MIKKDPKSLLTYSLVPTLILFVSGAMLVQLAMGVQLTNPFLLILGGVVAGYLVSKRFKSNPRG